MIEFNQETWYDKNDIENADKRIPISAKHLNRIEKGIAETVEQVNITTDNLTNYWWKKSKVIDGEIELSESSGTYYFYIWDNTTDNSVNIYYSDNVIIKTEEYSGSVYAELSDPQVWNPSYSSLGSSSTSVLKNKYFIVGAENTRQGKELYYARGSVSRKSDSSQAHRYGFSSASTYLITIRKIYGDVEYVNSNNQDAYINGWDVETARLYEYLGIPFENSRESCNMISGWYYGNEETTRLIRTDRKPKCVFLYRSDSVFNSTYSGITTETFSIGRGVTLSEEGFIVKYKGNVSDANKIGYKYCYIVFY